MFDQRIVAAIDIGSHNCRLQIAKKTNQKIEIIYNFSRQISLAQNLAFNNEFDEEKINNLLSILKQISIKINQYGVSDYRCVATEAFRQSINSHEVILKIKKTLGINVEIISMQEEAKLCLKGCERSFKNKKTTKVIFDIGGGSTEIILSKKNKEDQRTNLISVPYGVVNIEDYFHIFSKDKIKQKIGYQFRQFFTQHIQPLSKFEFIGSCATVTTICAISLGLSKYDKKKVEGKTLNINQIFSAIRDIKHMQITEKKNHPLIGNEKYFLLDSGIFILELLIEKLELKNLYILENKVKLGVLDEL